MASHPSWLSLPARRTYLHLSNRRSPREDSNETRRHHRRHFHGPVSNGKAKTQETKVATDLQLVCEDRSTIVCAQFPMADSAAEEIKMESSDANQQPGPSRKRHRERSPRRSLACISCRKIKMKCVGGDEGTGMPCRVGLESQKCTSLLNC